MCSRMTGQLADTFPTPVFRDCRSFFFFNACFQNKKKEEKEETAADQTEAECCWLFSMVYAFLFFYLLSILFFCVWCSRNATFRPLQLRVLASSVFTFRRISVVLPLLFIASSPPARCRVPVEVARAAVCPQLRLGPRINSVNSSRLVGACGGCAADSQ